MKFFYSMAVLFLLIQSLVAHENLYHQLSHLGDKADEESIELLKQTAASLGDLNDIEFLLFMVRDEFPCCAQVFPYVYDDQEYLVVRIWKALFDELTVGERRALFGHELMHVKNGDLKLRKPDFWLIERMQNLYLLLCSAIYSMEIKETVRFSSRRLLTGAGVFLVTKTAINECHQVYHHYEQREREKRAEFGAARLLKCARDSLSLNQKIDDRLRYNDPNHLFPLNHVVSLYDTHPSRLFFGRELAKMAFEQEKEAVTSLQNS